MFNFIKSLFKKELPDFTKVPTCFDEKDERNFGSFVLFGDFSKYDLPTESFIVYDPEQKDQAFTDFCTGESQAYGQERNDGEPLSGAFNFASNKKLSNALLSEWGASVLGGLKARQKYGITKESLWPVDVNKSRDEMANFDVIPDYVKQEALNHRGGAYFEVKRPFGWSLFDTIKACLNKNRQLIHSGIDGHATTFIGYLKAGDNFKDIKGIKRPVDLTFNEDVLIAKDSYDRPSMNYRAGEYHNGYRFFKLEESRFLFTCYFEVDMDRNLAELLVAYNNKVVKGSNERCYLIQNGKKCLIPNQECAWAYGIRLWKDVNTISDKELDLLPDGDMLNLKNGPQFDLVNEIINSPEVAKQFINK